MSLIFCFLKSSTLEKFSSKGTWYVATEAYRFLHSMIRSVGRKIAMLLPATLILPATELFAEPSLQPDPAFSDP